MVKKQFAIAGMHCVSCAMTIEGALEDVPGVKAARANYARQSADVEYDERKVSERQLVEAIEGAGYKVK